MPGRNSPIHLIRAMVAVFVFWAGLMPTPAQALVLPKPDALLALSPAFAPASLKGIVLHPDNALQFDFLITPGDAHLTETQKEAEYRRLITYFLASLTIPDHDQWVNLSPYEQGRTVDDNFGRTAMGRDLLAQDYLLKQMTSSLMHPDGHLGREFWQKVYARARRDVGNAFVPISTFNKVWIVPSEAMVYEHGHTAYIAKSRLKVMLEEDYLSTSKHMAGGRRTASRGGTPSAPASEQEIIRQVILPVLEQEINEGKNFSQLRQIFNSMLLATWFKKRLKESLVGTVYADHTKLGGIRQDPKGNDAIYAQYLAAYKRGMYNFIKEEQDPMTGETVPRKYFAGGMVKDFSMAAFVPVSGPMMSATVHKDTPDAVMVSLQEPGVGWRSIPQMVDDFMTRARSEQPENIMFFLKDQFFHFYQTVPASQAAGLARALNAAWETAVMDPSGASRETFAARYGSLFGIAIMATDHVYAEDVFANVNRWMDHFSDGASPIERAWMFGLRAFQVSAHLQYLGRHAEPSGSFVDNDLLLGTGDFPGLIEQYILALLALPAEDMQRPISGLPNKDGLPGQVVTNRDYLLWFLLVALNPALHAGYGVNDAARAKFAERYGDVTDEHIGVQLLGEVFRRAELRGQINHAEALIQEALQVPDAVWKDKGFLSPYTFGINNDNIQGKMHTFFLNRVRYKFPNPYPMGNYLFSLPRTAVNMDARFYPNLSDRNPAEEQKHHRNQALYAYPDGRRDLYERVYRSIFSGISDGAMIAEARAKALIDRFLLPLKEYTQSPQVFFAYLRQQFEGFAEQVPESEAASFARTFGETWKTTRISFTNGNSLTLEERYGSIHGIVPVVLSAFRPNYETMFRIHQWVIAFLSGGNSLERAYGLWLYGVMNVMHLLYFGLHTDKDGDGREHLTDNELLLGNGRTDALIEQYILALLDIRGGKEFNRPIAGLTVAGRERAELTNRDFLLWGLAVMLSPAVHTRYSTFLGEWRMEDLVGFGTDRDVAIRMLVPVFQKPSLKSKEADVRALVREALSIPDERWERKGFQSPYKFAMANVPFGGVLKGIWFLGDDASFARDYPLGNGLFALPRTAENLPDLTMDVGLENAVTLGDLSERRPRTPGSVAVNAYPNGFRGLYREVFSGLFPGLWDSAMTASSERDLGGIDFTRPNLLIRRDAKGIALPVAQQDMAKLAGITGLVPVILGIRPWSSLPDFN